jgi:hypothetical protein
VTERVYLGIPTRDGCLPSTGALIAASRSPYLEQIQIQSGSWLTRNFNECYAAALNLRPKITHFGLLHDDIQPLQADWLDRLVRISVERSAGVVSVVVPLKHVSGLTSTALDQGIGGMDQRYRVRRLTLAEVFKREPTWSEPDLLLNTGLMLVDIRQPWAEQLWFGMVDGIIRHEGKFRAVGFPEDWNFSRQVKKLGGTLWATREIQVEHLGGGRFQNSSPWGTLATDVVG